MDVNPIDYRSPIFKYLLNVLGFSGPFLYVPPSNKTIQSLTKGWSPKQPIKEMLKLSQKTNHLTFSL